MIFENGRCIYLIKVLTKGVAWEPPNKADYLQGYWLLSTSWQEGPISEGNIYTTYWR